MANGPYFRFDGVNKIKCMYSSNHHKRTGKLSAHRWWWWWWWVGVGVVVVVVVLVGWGGVGVVGWGMCLIWNRNVRLEIWSTPDPNVVPTCEYVDQECSQDTKFVNQRVLPCCLHDIIKNQFYISNELTWRMTFIRSDTVYQLDSFWELALISKLSSEV